MKFNLHFAYWTLFLISIISSSLLFFIVASESTKISANSDTENQVSELLAAAPSPRSLSSQHQTENNDKFEESASLELGVIVADGLSDNNQMHININQNRINLELVNEEVVSQSNSEFVSDISKSSDKVNVDQVPKIKKKFLHINNVDSGSVLKEINLNIDDETVQSHRRNDDEENGSTQQQQQQQTDVPETVGIHDMPVSPAVIKLNKQQPEFLLDSDSDDNDPDQLSDENENKTSVDYPGGQRTSAISGDDTKVSKDFVMLVETKKSTILLNEVPPDERSQKINDSGGINDSDGDLDEDPATINQESDEQLSTAKASVIPTVTTSSAEVNLTAEEHPIPVFSEWAQKQMEEAEKQLEKQVVNSSTMKKNTTNGNKPQMLKLRSKNYASPDCGAKIIASNIEAENTGALLTSSKDEYMLSPCTNRIWFVVELCEAIQAKQIELANFELFSSSPKNFTVAVSNRYPTREWSNVGRFIAEDSRNIQNFELHPHLFGKFVRVDIHSHYSSEHFCPISLFRVYGTSEFEAFETENRNPYDDIDDGDDDIGLAGIDSGGGAGLNGDINNLDADDNENNAKKSNQNLFKSASDAVMSIVKKAAQVLVKDKPNPNSNDMEKKQNELCFSPKFSNFECSQCSKMFVENVNNLLTCKFQQLINLLGIKVLRSHLIKSQICANRFKIELTPTTANSQFDSGCSINHEIITEQQYPVSMAFQEHHSYYLSVISMDYLAAMCHVLSQLTSPIDQPNKNNNIYRDDRNDPALNLTIDKKSSGSDDKDDDFIDAENLENEADNNRPVKKTKERIPNLNVNKDNIVRGTQKTDELENDSKKNYHEIPERDLNKEELDENSQLPLTKQDDENSVSNEAVINTENVNIFNLADNYDNEGAEIMDQENPDVITDEKDKSVDESVLVNSNENLQKTDENIVSSIQPTAAPSPSINIDVDAQAWDSIDTLLSEPVSGETNGGGGGGGGSVTGGNNYAGGYVQSKTGYHSESVFIRLSNRIKALERNMSLSGQYLEELSRRYKKQVEELQNSFAKSLTAIEEQNRRAILMEQFLMEQNINLKENLNELSQQFYFWISILLCVTLVVLVHVLISWYSVSSIGRKQGRLLQQYEENAISSNSKKSPKKLRRKSVEGVSGHPTPTHKTRRPSELAMRIVGSYKDLMISDDDDDDSIIDINAYPDEMSTNTNKTSSTIDNCSTGSWSNFKFKLPAQSAAAAAAAATATSTALQQRKRKPSVFCFRENQQQSTGYYRGNGENSKNVFATDDLNKSSSQQCQAQQQGIPEELLIVDEDYENFLPGTDLAYNEFMPDGPSGENNITGPKLNGGFFGGKKTSKFRRLSSPGFLKSPFSKNSNSSTSSSGSKKKIPPTEPTGWEWCRLKKTTSPNQAQQPAVQHQNQHVDNTSKSIKPELIIRVNGSSSGGGGGGGSCGSSGSTDKNPSTNSSEFVILNNSSNCSESDSLRTTHSEELSSLNGGGNGADIANTVHNIGDNLQVITNGNNNNKRNSKKQRSIRKILKKVF